MRIKNLFYLLLALPLVFAACEPENPDTDKPVDKEPVLTLTSNATLEFAAEGGEGEIGYTLENEKEGTKLTAECTAEWVTDLTVGDKVTFTVEANDAEEARETKITVKYDTKSFDVAVKQAAKVVTPEPPVTEYDFELVMYQSMRLNYAELGLASNEFLVAFADEYDEFELIALLIGAEEDVVLQSGTYSVAAGTMDTEYLIAGNEDMTYEFSDATFEVVFENGIYDMDMELTTLDGELFHFTFVGEIVGMEPAGPTTWEAPAFQGEYYGDEYSPGVGNYYVILTDNGFDAEGYLQPNSTYYILDIYGAMSEESGEYVTLPVGEYTLDPYDSMAAGTIGAYYSAYYATDDTQVTAQAVFDDATLVVTETGLTLTAIISGAEHTVTYNGEMLVYNGTAVSGDYYSTLTSDLELNIPNATYSLEYYGDYYNSTTDNWVLYIYEDSETYNGAYLMIDFLNDPYADNIAGTYTADDGSYNQYTYFPGYVDGEDMWGVWYVDMLDGYIGDAIAPIVDGTIVIEWAEGDVYTITLDCVDDAGHAITGTIVTAPIVYERPSAKSAKSEKVARESFDVAKARKQEVVKSVKMR